MAGKGNMARGVQNRDGLAARESPQKSAGSREVLDSPPVCAVNDSGRHMLSGKPREERRP